MNTRKLEEFYGDATPLYAILSHTWGEDEVLFQDLATKDHKQKHGYKKIEGCCQAAAEQHIKYVWVDSCCIDKSSSAELSEAINSMFNWYKASKVCFIYLEDVPTGLDPFAPRSAFRISRWWTRGWTLQELLAPLHIVFFDTTWERVFSSEIEQGRFRKSTLPVRSEEIVKRDEKRSEGRLMEVIPKMRYSLLTEITGIPSAVLDKELPLSKVSAACKFSWASQRMTTRVEDKAYCLMGLLGVNMPLLYGEGERAFVRLQELVIGSSDDISLLAWGYGLSWEEIEELDYSRPLARSPTAFRGYPKSKYQHIRRPPKTHSTVTGHGLHIELPLRLVDPRNRVWIAIIEESSDEDFEDVRSIALVLRQRGAPDTYTFERARGCSLIRILNVHSAKRLLQTAVSRMVYLQDAAIIAAPAELKKTTNLSRLLRPPLRSTKLKSNQKPYTTDLLVAIQSIRTIGYTISSRYPPLDHQVISLFAREDHYWVWSGGKIVSQQESSFETLLCQGPLNELFYFILANGSGHRIAVRVKVKYDPPYIRSYKVDLSQCSPKWNATALEYACNTESSTHTMERLHQSMRWSSWVDLWGPNDTKIHIRACPNEEQLAKRNVRMAECGLVWNGGWVSEMEESTFRSKQRSNFIMSTLPVLI